MLNFYAFFYLLAHAIPAVIGFGALIIYTHLLSPTEYGLYVVGASVAALISSTFFAWVRLSVSRYQADSADVDMRGSAVIAYAGTVVVLACLVPIATLVLPAQSNTSLIAGGVFMALTMSAFEISQEFKRAQQKPLHFTIIAISRSALSLLLGLASIKMGWGGIGLLLAAGASFLIGNLLNLTSGWDRRGPFFDAEQLMRMVRYGVPLAIGGITLALHSTLDRLAVAYLLNNEAAGQYGVAADMARQSIAILAASVASASFPIIFRVLAAKGPHATHQHLNDCAELLLALVAPVAIWLALSADIIAKALLGAEFQATFAQLLPYLAAARLFGALNQYFLHISYQLAERPFLQVIHDSLTFVVNVVLIVPMVWYFGLLGAAVATLVAEALGVLIGLWLSRRAFRLSFSTWRIARVLLAAAIMGATTYLATRMPMGNGIMRLIAVTAVGGLAYTAAALFFNVARVRSTGTKFFQPRQPKG